MISYQNPNLMILFFSCVEIQVHGHVFCSGMCTDFVKKPANFVIVLKVNFVSCCMSIQGVMD